MIYVVAYLITFAAFAAIDISWLMFMGAKLYKETLGDILAPQIRMGPAIAFYLLYPIGLVVFAVYPSLKSGSVGAAAFYGALFGFMAYATYELTNYATLRNWTLGITVIDIIYGAAVGAVVSAIAVVATPVVARWLGA